MMFDNHVSVKTFKKHWKHSVIPDFWWLWIATLKMYNISYSRLAKKAVEIILEVLTINVIVVEVTLPIHSRKITSSIFQLRLIYWFIWKYAGMNKFP